MGLILGLRRLIRDPPMTINRSSHDVDLLYDVGRFKDMAEGLLHQVRLIIIYVYTLQSVV